MIRKIITIFVIIILGAIIGAAIYFRQTLANPFSHDSTNVPVTIAEHTSSKSIATQLHSQHLITSEMTFLIYVKVRRLNLQPGNYIFRPNMTIPEIARRLNHAEVETVTLTFPEGWRLTQMADRLSENGLVKKDDFLKAAEGQEGYLFPDTYTFKMNTNSAEIIQTMRQDFDKRTADLKPTPDVVILASIVEREAAKDTDRAQIAAVYANRLKIGMRLEADPTVQYAIGSWDPITQADYQSTISAYNTYLHAGLPPGPICNPGLKSLQAAAHPATSDYFYFFNTLDGKTIFSKTLAEHEANLLKYPH